MCADVPPLQWSSLGHRPKAQGRVRSRWRGGASQYVVNIENVFGSEVVCAISSEEFYAGRSTAVLFLAVHWNQVGHGAHALPTRGGGRSGSRLYAGRGSFFAVRVQGKVVRTINGVRARIFKRPHYSMLAISMADQASFDRSNSLTSRGLALPLVDFITWPTKKPSRLVLPSR